MDVSGVMDGLRVAISPEVYAEVIAPGSPAYAEATRLQVERFAQVSTVKRGAQTTYAETTDYAPQQTIPLVVRRRHAATQTDTQAADTLLGTARLEQRGATLIEAMLRLAPGSQTAMALHHGRAAEIGAFAPVPDLDKAGLVDVVDAMVAMLVRLATERHIDWLLIFPRNGFMSLMWAEIPGLLPPYRFTPCHDVLGWNEGSERLEQFRALRLKGVGEQPEVYQIRRSDLAADLARRLALLPERRARADELNQQLLRAMCRARQQHARATRGGAEQREAARIAS